MNRITIDLTENEDIPVIHIEYSDSEMTESETDSQMTESDEDSDMTESNDDEEEKRIWNLYRPVMMSGTVDMTDVKSVADSSGLSMHEVKHIQDNFYHFRKKYEPLLHKQHELVLKHRNQIHHK